ncbi:MAG: N-acetylmuramoyl-L-alanine amidase [Chloroflexi bacterium]|nr:N-acetylmuramoyl-L-alanine amidase [Chloroflexota bacterium]MDA1240756.1 N-acetylmuramoyl-L-alanine amidase [Chloroflexota bacterium]
MTTTPTPIETIDLTDRYHQSAYMAGGAPAWTLDRARQPVRAVILHHTAGWYGAPPGASATVAAERIHIDALARDHRTRFGIGPGYHYLAFPSGRLYAVGKWGTHRAHTTGRHPATGERWNVQAVGVCAFGDYERDQPPPRLLDALRSAFAECTRIAGRPLPVIAHGVVPSVDASGVPFAQATACPGARLREALEVTRPAVTSTSPVVEAREALRRARSEIERAAALLDALG